MSTDYRRLSIKQKAERVRQALAAGGPMGQATFRCTACGVELLARDAEGHVGRCPRRGDRD
jgi:hypothetical protein